MNPGTIVRCRNRDWVLLPSDDPNVHLLRPLAGSTDEVVAIHKQLANIIGSTFPQERVAPSRFPLPSADDVSDAASAHLLWQAARLTLREGAAPLRSLGRISIRPRVYQFVPLLMALRLDPVRLFIADDVGVGKTIEALLVARELLDRGEVRRLAVLCPPYLCDQWQSELAEKFSLDAVIIRSGTVAQLERRIPAGRSIYEHYPIQVISIDWVKSDRNKHQFLLCCPELVIVDEAHGAAEASDRNQSQQQRHQLLLEVARDDKRHLILLTATPHSGISTAFRSLLGLLHPDFAAWDVSMLKDQQRERLARHFVQRVRRDIEKDWESDPCFPVREASDETYELSPAYRDLFERTYKFCSEIIRTGEKLEQRKRRVRYWGALALLRCVMSSPASAVAALKSRVEGGGERRTVNGEEGEDESDLRGYVFESAEDRTDDETPTPPIEEAELTLDEADRRQLRALDKLAERLRASGYDTKLSRCCAVVSRLLSDGFHPIVWCRYVATADYVADGLRRSLADSHADVQVVCITGRQPHEERRTRIEEINAELPRVLVATDCLSEGINLQDKFTAVLHYDLPWNPNRLEQREGRVDRYGQTAKRVKAVRFFGRDNPVDGAVIRVLLDKAREIHRALGTHVPVPEEAESVTEAVLNALFLRPKSRAGQLQLDLDMPEVDELHRRWDQDAERERTSRTKFAQRALKPEEVKRELEAADAVLGDPDAVREFVLAASQRIGMHIERDKRRDGVYRIPLDSLALSTVPEPVRLTLPRLSPPATRSSPVWLISFDSPTPEGAEYLGRNHPFVSALARYLVEDALTNHASAVASRCGVIRTKAVSELTRILLLRVRYLLEQPGTTPLLSEEVVVAAYTMDRQGRPAFLSDADALHLLAETRPDANVPLPEKRELVRSALHEWQSVQPDVEQIISRRAQALENSHKRIRAAVRMGIRGLSVKPQLPPDLLGLLVLQPVVMP